MPRFQFSGGGWYSQASQNSKCQDLPKFKFSGGGVKTENTQSAKKCLDLNFRGWGVGGWGVKTENTKILKVPRNA